MRRRSWNRARTRRDFPILAEFFAAGATDYLAYILPLREGTATGRREPASSHSFRDPISLRGGFSDDDTRLLQATLPALSLAMKSHAGYVVASGLLASWLGEDAGRRVHAGSIMRGSWYTLRAVIWYPDIRGFTAVSNSASRIPAVVELLNDIFRGPDRLAAPARRPAVQIHRRCDARRFLVRGARPGRNLPARARRRDRGDANRAIADEQGARGGFKWRPSISRSISARCSTAIFGRPGPGSELRRHRPGRQRGRPPCEGFMRAARPRGSRLGRIRRRSGEEPTNATFRAVGDLAGC